MLNVLVFVALGFLIGMPIRRFSFVAKYRIAITATIATLTVVVVVVFERASSYSGQSMSGLVAGSMGLGVWWALSRQRVGRDASPEPSRNDANRDDVGLTQVGRTSTAGSQEKRLARFNRVHIGLAALALIAWFTWVGLESDGFSTVRPLGWIVIFGAPVLAYALLATLMLIAPNLSTHGRRLFSAASIWVFLAGAWGFIWDWRESFTTPQYVGLLLLPPVGFWLGYLLWRWSSPR